MAALDFPCDPEEHVDGTVPWEDDLPLGIFPEAHPESCYHALRQQGLACTRLNAELFYEMGQIRRNLLLGCSTEELREIDLWDPCSDVSVWEEPSGKAGGRLLPPEERLENLNRQARWDHVERFLKHVYQWCQDGRAPEIVTHRNHQGRNTWRFRQLVWTEDGTTTPNSAPLEIPSGPTEILHAAWNFLFWCRRKWLKAYPGKVWLSEHCLHLIRHAFKALLAQFDVPPADWPEIREEAKPAWPSTVEARLAELKNQERRGLARLHHLQCQGRLTGVKLRLVIDFLDKLADEIALTQRRLDETIIMLARNNGYDEGYWGTRLELSHLSPDELLEMREEMRLVVTEYDQPSTGEPLTGSLIPLPPAQPTYI